MNIYLIRSLFQRQPGKEKDNVLLVVQCQSAHLYGDLIACARYRVSDERAKALALSPGAQTSSRSIGCTHVLFIIYLPRQTPSLSFVGFQGDPWSSVHIDELRLTNDEITYTDLFECPISKLFCSPPEAESTAGGQYHKRLHSCIQAAVATLQDSLQTSDRGKKLVAVLLDLVPKFPPKDLGMCVSFWLHFIILVLLNTCVS